MVDRDEDLLGLTRGEVRLEPSNAAWERDAQGLIRLLHLALGSDAVAIEHVGSTAVAGLVAKPIIDIVVGIGSESHRDSLVPVLETTGLIYRGDLGASGGLLVRA